MAERQMAIIHFLKKLLIDELDWVKKKGLLDYRTP